MFWFCLITGLTAMNNAMVINKKASKTHKFVEVLFVKTVFVGTAFVVFIFLTQVIFITVYSCNHVEHA